MNIRQLKRRFVSRWCVQDGAIWLRDYRGRTMYGVGIGGWPVRILASPAAQRPRPVRFVRSALMRGA